MINKRINLNKQKNNDIFQKKYFSSIYLFDWIQKEESTKDRINNFFIEQLYNIKELIHPNLNLANKSNKNIIINNIKKEDASISNKIIHFWKVLSIWVLIWSSIWTMPVKASEELKKINSENINFELNIK